MPRTLRPILICLILGLVSLSTPAMAQTVDPSCTPNVVPIGQQNPLEEPAPLVPIWCVQGLQAPPSTFQSGANDWLDPLGADGFYRFNDGDAGYRIFEAQPAPNYPVKSQHFRNGGDWFTDIGSFGKTNIMAALRPNRSFTFENGKLVVEFDVSAGIDWHSGGGINTEIDFTTAPAPTGKIVDALYGHGQFGGAWTMGCRLNGGRQIICALESSQFNVPNNQASCNMEQPSRIWELSDFERCGSTHFGFSGAAGGYARQCPTNASYDLCLDRYRIELSKSGIVIYINGRRYAEDSGWDAAHSIPDDALAQPWYVYAIDWVGGNNPGPVYRYTWQRIAVNPATGPSASPTFCQGQPSNTCQEDTPPTSTPQPTSTSVPTNTPTPTSTPQPTDTATPTPTSTSQPVPTSTPTPQQITQILALPPGATASLSCDGGIPSQTCVLVITTR